MILLSVLCRLDKHDNFFFQIWKMVAIIKSQPLQRKTEREKVKSFTQVGFELPQLHFNTQLSVFPIFWLRFRKLGCLAGCESEGLFRVLLGLFVRE